MAGREVRSAAFAFYSKVQQMRYAGGGFSYGQPAGPLVVADGEQEVPGVVVDVGVCSSTPAAAVAC